MRVIGVVDVRGGRAVHARAGARDRYEPVAAPLGSTMTPGDAVGLVRHYAALGLAEIYVADLDAIMASHQAPMRGATAATNSTLVATIAAIDLPLWVDAGVSSVAGARHTLGRGATRLVVGLETLSSFAALTDICEAVGGECVTFSLDVRNGEPVGEPGCLADGDRAEQVAGRAVSAGVTTIIVLDLARVGTGAGIDLTLIRRVREAAPEITLLAGGGVRGLDDLIALADAGANGALVASAIQDGRLSAADLRRARHYDPATHATIHRR